MADILPLGKLSPELLERCVLGYVGAHRDELLVGPAVGEDAAVIDWPAGKYMVVASDPIVGATKGAGRLLVQVNANDVAVKGADPAFMVVTLILPPKMGERAAADFMAEIHAACCELGVAVAGGHTEYNRMYDHPVLIGTMIGTAERVMRASDIRPGHVVIATKHLGIEGMSIIASDRPDLFMPFMSEEEIKEVSEWSAHTSVLPEASALRGMCAFMHDPTEGGFRGGLDEIGRLAGLEFHIDYDTVPLHPLTARAASCLGFDPLRLIASGSLLAVIPPEAMDAAAAALNGILWAKVGHVGKEPFGGPVSVKEELWGILERA